MKKKQHTEKPHGGTKFGVKNASSGRLIAKVVTEGVSELFYLTDNNLLNNDEEYSGAIQYAKRKRQMLEHQE